MKSLLLLALAGAVLVCYFNSLQCGLVFDDISAVKDNKDLRHTTPWTNLFLNDFWGTPMYKERSHKSYRPLCVLTFRLNYAISGQEPMLYHLVNVLLHVVVCCMYMRVCQMFMSQMASFLAAMLFAVHPIHTEAVTGVVGRAETLSSLFFLAAFLSYARSTGRKAVTVWSQLLLTVLLVTVAVLCKEQGLTVIGVCCVYEIFVAQKMTILQLLDVLKSCLRGKAHLPSWLKAAIVRCAFLVLSTLLLLSARIKVMGAQLPVFTKFDNPASQAATPYRQMTYNYLLSVNAWLLLFPYQLCCDWTMGTIPLITSLFDVRNIATVLFYAVLFKYVYYALKYPGKRARAIIMSLSLLVLPFIPASNLFFPVGFVVAERILYVPSMGFCMLVALGFEQLLSKGYSKPVLWSLMSVLLVSHSMKTIHRNQDWRSEYTLFMSGIKVNHKNAKLYNNVGHSLENMERYDEALQYFLKAAQIQEDDIGAHINVGRTYSTLQKSSEAESAFRKALDLMPKSKGQGSYQTRIAPSHLNVFLNLANLISKNSSRLLEADALYQRALTMRADYTQAYINRGDILLRLNKSNEAKKQYLKALQYESDNPDLYYNLGVVALDQGQPNEAISYFDKALALNPDHKQTLFNSGVLLQETGEARLRPEAFRRLKHLVKLDPDNERVYFNLGMLATDDKDYSAAEAWFKKSIELKKDFRSALFNLALMLTNDATKPLEAVPYLEQLLHYYPDHTKGLILMGDININHLKNIDAAEQNFKTILEKDATNVQAKHNLCVVHVERGDLREAEKCLVETANLAPTETYIQNHLSIVRSRLNAGNGKNNNKNGGNDKEKNVNNKKNGNGGDDKRKNGER